jgi:NitT/TauT family transport system ATP-binding protein
VQDIVVKHLYKAYDGRTVLRDISFTLPRGERRALMGPSGCGKTTLFRLLLGLERPDGGEICGLPARISAVFQEDRLCEELSAYRNLRITLPPSEVGESDIRDMLAALGLGEDSDRPVSELSGGMKRRVAIARALLLPATLLLLDEPFRGLDEATRARVAAVISAACADRTVLLITHDREEASLLCAPLLPALF